MMEMENTFSFARSMMDEFGRSVALARDVASQNRDHLSCEIVKGKSVTTGRRTR